MPGCRGPSFCEHSMSSELRRKSLRFAPVLLFMFVLRLPAWAVEGDRATHQSDHAEDVLELPEVHVHGLPLNKDQQVGPVPTSTPWPKIPAALDGQELDDWMKARLLVTKDAQVTVIVLEPAKHRELTRAGLAALQKWKFDPQMRGDDPIDGEVTVRIHFRTQ
jgi:TonB family protein